MSALIKEISLRNKLNVFEDRTEAGMEDPSRP
jgi:hypothetical protein